VFAKADAYLQAAAILHHLKATKCPRAIASGSCPVQRLNTAPLDPFAIGRNLELNGELA
jgi:hypothetical protein